MEISCSLPCSDCSQGGWNSSHLTVNARIWLRQGPFQALSLWHSQVGGFDGNSRLQSVEAYNPITNAWHAVPSMLNPRSNFGIEVMDGLLFVVGGFNGFSTTVATECYEEDTNEWYDAHSMGITRSAVSCCVVPGLSNVMEYIARQHYYQHSSSMDFLFTSSTRSSPL